MKAWYIVLEVLSVVLLATVFILVFYGLSRKNREDIIAKEWEITEQQIQYANKDTEEM